MCTCYYPKKNHYDYDQIKCVHVITLRRITTTMIRLSVYMHGYYPKKNHYDYDQIKCVRATPPAF